MNKNIKVDMIQKTITITRGFYRASQTPGTMEYETLRRVQCEMLGYEIKLAQVPRRDNRKLFPTYDAMFQFIRLNSGDEAELCSVIEMARNMLNPYNFVRRWFFDKYPEYNGEWIAA